MSGMDGLIGEIPAVVKVMVSFGKRITIRISISVDPSRCHKQCIQHLVQFLLCICLRHVNLDSLKQFIVNDMVLWGHQSSLWIVDKDYIACMLWLMTNIYTLVRAFLSFTRTECTCLHIRVKNIHQRPKHFEIIQCVSRILICEQSE